MNIDLVFLLFALAAQALFAFVRPATAAWVTFLGGWIILPVGHFPAGSAAAEFPYWISGLALPSDMLLTKAWVAPAAMVLAGDWAGITALAAEAAKLAR